MKTSVIAATALAALLVAGVAAVAMAHQTGTQGNLLGPNNGHNEDNENEGGHGHATACMTFSSNETLSLSNLTGHYINFAGNSTTHGNASGSFSFTVGQTFMRGCTLNITGGSIKLGNTTYAVTGGSLVLSFGGRAGIGTGTTSGGSFLIGLGGLHGNSTSASVGAIRLDFKTGSSEYLVILGSPESESD